MTELEGQFFCEYTYKRQAEGKALFIRVLFVLMYAVFAALYFFVCYVSRFIPMFALCPIFVWMLVYFTWRYASHDYYFEFRSGTLTVGVVMRKRRLQTKRKKCEIRVKDALDIVPIPRGRVKLDGTDKLLDFSGSRSSDKRIAIIYTDGKEKRAAVLECTMPLLKLIFSYFGKTDMLLEFAEKL